MSASLKPLCNRRDKPRTDNEPIRHLAFQHGNGRRPVNYRLVPHWNEAADGPEQYSIPIGSHLVPFCNHSRLTPALRTLLARISARTQALPLEQFHDPPGLIDVLLESFAIEWLKMHSPGTDWVRFIKYLESLARRTYENQPVALNLIIRKEQGRGGITRP